MALIKSISGFRGTIGKQAGENLTPKDVMAFTTGYAAFVKECFPNQRCTIALGRDGRISGSMLQDMVKSTLQACGVDVHILDYTTTPTIEMYVQKQDVQGGIILTASHNPQEWNALKMLNAEGEFVNALEGKRILELAEDNALSYAEVDDLGHCQKVSTALDDHIAAICAFPLVNVRAIALANFSVVFDAINSTAAMALPPLFKALGVKNVAVLNGEITGRFAHNPEPLNQHIVDLCHAVSDYSAHIGFAVDPDVDRLALVDENGNPIGEEYTLVSIADFMLGKQKGAAVSNLSSTRALSDVCKKHGVPYVATAVGEVNVVKGMKENHALIGGEGNGGIIVPGLHYGRDALIGIALILSYMAESKLSLSQIRAALPHYEMVKDKINLSPEMDVDKVLSKLKQYYSQEPNVKLNDVDGVKIDFSNGWVHCRKSNTEPIIRVYAEAGHINEALALVEAVKKNLDFST